MVILLIIGISLLIALTVGYIFQIIVAILDLFDVYSSIKTKQDLFDAFIPYRPLYLKIKKIYERLD